MKLKKNIQYKNERYEIYNNLLEKLGVNKENNRILKEDIEKDEIKSYIKEKLDDIKKFYSTGQWRSIYRENNVEMNIIKNIMRENNIEILKLERKRKNDDDKYHSYRIYVFMFP